MTEPFQLFDALPAHIEDALRASIDRFGVLVPVTVDQHGAMLDGHHRARIADELGVHYDRLVRDCTDDDERREIARTLNSDRRQLSEEQRLSVTKALREQGHTLRAIAGALGVSKSTVANDVAQLSSDGQLNQPERVKSLDGKSRPARRPQVYARDEREQKQAQQALIATSFTMPDGVRTNMPADRPLLASEATRLAARQRTPDPVDKAVPPPVGKYRCIVIDPPWPMKKIERDERPNQGLELDYPTMTLEQIADEAMVPVRTLADDDCHIYLWVTHKFLPAGLELLDTWGFNYQCVMTWRKNVGITPFSWMYDTEHVLFGRRGNLPLERLGMRLSFDAPTVGHSVKPDVFYDRVLEATPGPRVEMFARRERDGFTGWGNEVPDASRI